ncbi:peptidoglycan-associated lipoprotein Pal [Defluviimonas sp. D31]|uniref:peptidoglycan-associated lipoprotein Pal n=1 Tax=Defluviimonas sp. D31 TaxID=3083253 RepID=UPI00296FBD34|nr:peptidoglycan-associated lipoprotein Pal [Defluviimonas sp. D31]MDW4551056.1 peptidoglycan-associated lipoprotein Pal [Defluviimonas sp. D31]
MYKVSSLLLLVGALALSACNNPDRYGAGSGAGGVGGAGGAGGYGAGGITAGGLGDPNDPNSLAYFQQRIGDRVLFAVDQSTLTAEAQATLASQAAWLNQHPTATAIVEGHADEQGTREYNLALGARRASAVQQYLIAQGVAANRLQTVSYGKERPLAVCSDEACYSQNRRAVTVIGAGAGV